MANIRIIAGTYGFRENGMIHPKDAHSGVFEVDDKEAERLVALNVAAYAADEIDSALKNGPDIGAEEPVME